MGFGGQEYGLTQFLIISRFAGDQVQLPESLTEIQLAAVVQVGGVKVVDPHFEGFQYDDDHWKADFNKAQGGHFKRDFSKTPFHGSGKLVQSEAETRQYGEPCCGCSRELDKFAAGYGFMFHGNICDRFFVLWTTQDRGKELKKPLSESVHPCTITCDSRNGITC